MFVLDIQLGENKKLKLCAVSWNNISGLFFHQSHPPVKNVLQPSDLIVLSALNYVPFQFGLHFMNILIVRLRDIFVGFIRRAHKEGKQNKSSVNKLANVLIFLCLFVFSNKDVFIVKNLNISLWAVVIKSIHWGVNVQLNRRKKKGGCFLTAKTQPEFKNNGDLRATEWRSLEYKLIKFYRFFYSKTFKWSPYLFRLSIPSLTSH